MSDPITSTSMALLNVRSAFEAVASDNGQWPRAIERDLNGNYLLMATARGWSWWQAACAALADTPSTDTKSIELEATEDMLSTARLELDMLRKALGVSVEPHQSLFERMLEAAKLTAAARDVLAERARQIVKEGYDPEHDDHHLNDEIAAMATLFIMPEGAREWDATSTSYGDTMAEAMLPYGWEMPYFGEDRRRQLVKGTAMGLAEIERIDRATAAKDAQS